MVLKTKANDGCKILPRSRDEFHGPRPDFVRQQSMGYLQLGFSSVQPNGYFQILSNPAGSGSIRRPFIWGELGTCFLPSNVREIILYDSRGLMWSVQASRWMTAYTAVSLQEAP
ncbi:hypothetical protein TNCV_4502671 [Trichonephila clavipes]|nr:hypothetical protein TNCV_4502671 [Trichonephila clavipes]